MVYEISSFSDICNLDAMSLNMCILSIIFIWCLIAVVQWKIAIKENCNLYLNS